MPDRQASVKTAGAASELPEGEGVGADGSDHDGGHRGVNHRGPGGHGVGGAARGGGHYQTVSLGVTVMMERRLKPRPG